MEPHPVFIVGAPRSGTTLLAALLTAHTRFAGGPETQFFAHWRGVDQRRILEDPQWPARATAFLGSLSTVHGKLHEALGVSLDDISGFLAARPPRADFLLESLTQTHARRAGKPRWVEKSPGHLYDVREIRRVFPQAPILRLVRDPRDVALSLQAVPWGARSVLANAYLWRSMDRASAEFFATNNRSLTVLYEKLVTRPEDELRRVCAFLGEEFEPRMLDTRGSIMGLSLPGEWWKDRAGTPVESARAFAWKRGFPREDLAALEMICQEGLDDYGYERTARATRTHRVYSLDAPTVALCEGLLRRTAAVGARLVPFRYENVTVGDPVVWPGALLFLGESIPGRTATQRWSALKSLGRTLVLRRLHGKKSIWIRHDPTDPETAVDSVARAARLLLRAACTASNRQPWPSL
jgi:hypothetical protein